MTVRGLAPDESSVGAWGRAGVARGVSACVFSREILTLLRSFCLDVLLQRRLFTASPARWVAHLVIRATP